MMLMLDFFKFYFFSKLDVFNGWIQAKQSISINLQYERKRVILKFNISI